MKNTKSQPSLKYLTNLPSFTQQKITQMKASWSPLSGVASLSAKLAEALASKQLFLSRKGGRVNHGWKNISNFRFPISYLFKISNFVFSICLVFLISYLVFGRLQPAFAQTSSLTAIPPRQQFIIEPGQTKQLDLKIRNETDTLQYYQVQVQDFIVSDLNGTPVPVTQQTSGRWSLASWIISPTFLPVDAKTTQPVKISITAPANALPGGHYAMITYQPNPDLKRGDLSNTGSLIGQRTGTLLYATVPGDITQDALLKSFFTPQFTEYGPIDFQLQIENLSDVHIQPQGTITITDIFGKKLDTLPVQMSNIFPDNTRQFTTQWQKKWGYGRYQADLKLAYGTQGGTITSSILFWFFPIRIVIYSLILLLSIAALIIIFRRRHISHEKELEEEVKELKQELDQKE